MCHAVRSGEGEGGREDDKISSLQVYMYITFCEVGNIYLVE